MVWVAKPFPTVPGLDIAPPRIAKRLWSVKLHQLINDRWSYFERSFVDSVERVYGSMGVEEAIRFVVEVFEYPLYLGIVPTDWHSFDGFRLWFLPPIQRIDIELDYWRSAAESMLFYEATGKGVGDCEDCSILLGAAMKLLGVDYYVCMGMVYRGSELLGGHAWVLASIDGSWRLVETTLDRMPRSFPEVDVDSNVYVVGDLRYEAMLRFNHIRYEEWGEEGDRFAEYLGLDPRRKRGRRKLRAIRSSWARA